MFKNIKNIEGVTVLNKQSLNSITGKGNIYYCINSNGNGAYTDTDISGNGIHCTPVAEVAPKDKSTPGNPGPLA
ncbi:hypothetical protein [Tenacibaculum sp. 190524A05c]|uniref:Uncharacterized protein n=1 Tax=Tenacibaculum platacis TaxID=3137852 RepID=A0ABP1EPS2_9FLAO